MKKLSVLWIIVVLFFLGLMIGLWNIQIRHGQEYFVLSEDNRIRFIPTNGPRGTIFDNNLEPLARNRPCFNINIIPEEILKHPQAVQILADILQIDSATVWKKIKKNKNAGFLPVKIKKDVALDIVAKIEERQESLPGVYVSPESVREYLKGNFLSHVLGYVGEINKNELEKLRDQGYKIKDTIGKDGVEQSYDQYLQGERGGTQVEVSASGRYVKVLSKKDPAKGKDIVLTIDGKMQKIVEDVFSNEIGSVIIMDPSNGEILSFVSKPSFNPNIFVNPFLKDDLKKVLFDRKNKPLMDRAIIGQYAPGSLFKMIVGIAGLKEKKIAEDTAFNCTGEYKMGRVFHCWDKEGHGLQNIVAALTHSCNIYFFNLGQLLGIDKIEKYASLFGFGQKTNIDLCGEKKGFVPSKIWKREKYKADWYPGETANLSIGQGYTTVTPIQMVCMLSAIANGGFLVTPKLVKKIVSNDGQEIQIEKDIKNLNISTHDLEIIRRGMRAVVNSPSGTGRLAKLDHVVVAGKTGTAQVASSSKSEGENVAWKFRNHAWFGCFAPYDHPTIAMVVMVEHGGSGEQKGAVIAHEILKRIFEEKP